MLTAFIAATAVAVAGLLAAGAGAASESPAQGDRQAADTPAVFAGSELLREKPKPPRIPQQDIRRLRKAPCPPPYLVRVQRDYNPEEVAAARHFDFNIAGQNVNLKPPINWRLDPINSASFRARLHDLRWLDILLYDYHHNQNRASLKKARFWLWW